MNRNELRANKHKFDKNREWFAKLPDSKKRYIGYFIEQKAIENDNITAEILDDCFKAAMIGIKDLSLSECKEIITLANEYMEEAKNILEKDMKGEYLVMVKDENLRNEIREEVKGIIKDNRKINNLEIIRILDKEYDLPKKDYQIICKEVREELSKEVLKDIENDINEKEKELATLGKDISSNAAGEISATFLAMEGEQGFELAQPKNNSLKIKSIEVEGEYGTYKKDSEGVKTSQSIFKDIKELQLYKENAQAEIENQKDTLKEQIEELQGKLRKLNEDSIRECAFIAEVKEVFNM